MIPTVVLLAAGMSTRYGRLKQLEPVGPDGEALLDFAVFDARRAGFSRILLIIRKELEGAFRDHMEGRWPRDMDVVFHHQRIDDLAGLATDPQGSPSPAGAPDKREKPWGTGHAVLTARSQLPGPFVVINADDFYGEGAFRAAAEFISGASPSSLWTPVGTEGVPGSLSGKPPGPGAGDPAKAEADLPTFGLITYVLGDTLSDHGGVSRGICQVDSQGWLHGIEEGLEIRRVDGGVSGRAVSGQRLVLEGREPVSTNFWIFTPAVFPLLEAGFVDFMGTRGGLTFPGARLSPPGSKPTQPQGKSTSPQPEFLIPTEVNRAIRGGSARVAGIPVEDRFFGITHPRDREEVAGALKEMTAEGMYPSPLWA